LLAFALHAETQTEAGPTERVFGAKIGLLFADGSWRVVAEGRTPAYSPDGRVIAISHERLRKKGDNSAPSGIVLHRLDGRPIRRLTWGSDREPTWSPSGRRLAFARTTCVRRRCSSRIFTIGRDGRDKRFLVDGYSPAWSSRGQIAFTRYRDFQSQLWVTTTRAKSPRRLPPLRRFDRAFEPEWSPSGDRILFARDDRSAEAGGVAVVKPGGTGLHWILRLPDNWVATPKWAPDGRVAFMASDSDLYTAPADGGSLTLLLADPPVRDWCHRCGRDYLVTWFDGFDFRPVGPP
jgi:Tol biopolymer transport system component